MVSTSLFRRVVTPYVARAVASFFFEVLFDGMLCGHETFVAGQL
jgi:hypothetical protein